MVNNYISIVFVYLLYVYSLCNMHNVFNSPLIYFHHSLIRTVRFAVHSLFVFVTQKLFALAMILFLGNCDTVFRVIHRDIFCRFTWFW